MKLQPVSRNSLVDEVVERIQGVLGNGEMESGAQLPSELELAKQLAVSRSVIREALSRLTSLGLVVRRSRRMFIGDNGSLSSCAKLIRAAMTIAPKDLLQFNEFRRPLECYNARVAAEKASADDCDALAALTWQMDARGRDRTAAIQADVQFHLKLVEITGNELTRNVMEVLLEFVIASVAQTYDFRPSDGSRPVHMAVVEAIRKKDPDAAEKAMQHHMDRAARQLKEAERQRNRKVKAVG